MVIGEHMIHLISRWFVVLVVLFCASAVFSLEEKKKDTEEVLIRQLVNSANGEVHEDLAELLQSCCRSELKEAGEVPSSCIPKEVVVSESELNSHGWFASKATVQKSFEAQHYQGKQTLLDCIGKNNLPFDISGKESDFGIWSNYNSPRRNLIQRIAWEPLPSPSTPFTSPPAPQIPTSPFNAGPSPAPSPEELPFPKEGGVDSPPEDISAGPLSSPTVHTVNDGNNRNSIVIAVVVTATVTFVVAAFFFFCCSRICRNVAGAGRNDERHLLSSSDYSIGSSPNLYGFTNSVKEEKHSHKHSLSDLLALDATSSYVEDGLYKLDRASSLRAIDSTIKTSPEVHIVVQPPPSSIGGDLSLKPPPGRAQPLASQPPTSVRPSSSTASPLAPPSAPNGSAGPHPPAAPRAPGAPPSPLAPGVKVGPRPPPPPTRGVGPPRPPPPLGPKAPRPPSVRKLPSDAASGDVDDNGNAPKAKLKPFFWDKVMAEPDQSMVWHHIKSGSFQFNEEMIETLFGCASAEKAKNERKKESSSQDPSPQYVQILDPKKAQNLLILLRAQNITIEEVCDALLEGNELPTELLYTLLKMAPTEDEELKLRLFNGEISQLGPAERFLKVLVDIPFAYKRMEALVFMCTLQEDVTSTKESFKTLEVACKELRSSRLFLKLLEAVLKTGNRMNDGTYRGGAQAFKLDTLLKLADVKGTDGKTTLLHFVVKEIIRSEGVRAARSARENRSLSGLSAKTEDLLEEIAPDTEEHFRNLGLQGVSHLTTELQNVKKAAIIDANNLMGIVAKLGQSISKTQNFLNKEMSNVEEDNGFIQTVKFFVQNAEADITKLLEEEKRIMALVKSTGDYFHGNSGKDEGLRLFVIVRDFLIILDNVCKEVREAQKRAERALKKETSNASTTSETCQQQSNDLHKRLFPAIADQRTNDSRFSSSSSSSSDNES